MFETHVAVMRGINVGGKNKLPMKDLAAGLRPNSPARRLKPCMRPRLRLVRAGSPPDLPDLNPKEARANPTGSGFR
jgi:hypothetical protein